MRIITITILFYLSIQTLKSQIIKNVCDNNLLNSKELEKCINDSIFIDDFEYRINYITRLTTEVYPKYRKERKKLQILNEIKSELKLLKKIYDSVSTKKIDIFQKDTFNNGLYVNPKAFLSTTIALQSFKIYPDTYAMLINRTHIILNPETSEKNLETYTKLIDTIYNKLSQKDKEKLIKTVSLLRKEKIAIQINRFSELFQDDEMPINEREKFDVVDYLLWSS